MRACRSGSGPSLHGDYLPSGTAGLLWHPWPDLDLQPASREEGVDCALVFVERESIGDHGLAIDHALGQHGQGALEAVEHGHRRIGYLGDMHTIVTAAERYRGYLEELAEHGIDAAGALVRLDLRGIEKAEAAVIELVGQPDPPTALFTGQNLITIGAFRALRRSGLHHRIALIGFDDILLADLLEPGITVIAQDPSAMGRTAAQVLFRRLDGDRSPSEHHVVLTRMITRGSGEIAP
jgi:LacI family transcriptional regulator